MFLQVSVILLTGEGEYPRCLAGLALYKQLHCWLVSVGEEAANRYHQMHDGIGHMVLPPGSGTHPPPPDGQCNSFHCFLITAIAVPSFGPARIHFLGTKETVFMKRRPQLLSSALADPRGSASAVPALSGQFFLFSCGFCKHWPK